MFFFIFCTGNFKSPLGASLFPGQARSPCGPLLISTVACGSVLQAANEHPGSLYLKKLLVFNSFFFFLYLSPTHKNKKINKTQLQFCCQTGYEAGSRSDRWLLSFADGGKTHWLIKSMTIIDSVSALVKKSLLICFRPVGEDKKREAVKVWRRKFGINIFKCGSVEFSDHNLWVYKTAEGCAIYFTITVISIYWFYFNSTRILPLYFECRSYF